MVIFRFLAKKGFVARQVLTVYDTSPPRHVSMPDQMLQGVSVSPGLSAGSKLCL